MSIQNVDQPLKQVADLVHEATDVDWKAGVRATVRAILAPLASLKLTVVLLALAVLVIWIVTLEQTRYGIWTVKQKHFPALFVYIPFQYFFPPGWFPILQKVPGGFFMPSGTLILVAMIVNLLAAHLFRMRIQANGIRLALGASFVAAGLCVTWGVVFYGQNPKGFQGEPPISYQWMWSLIQVGMLGLIVFSAGAIFWMKDYRLVERLLLGVFAFLMIGLLAFLVYEGKEAFIGDSAMRILWQLIQSTIAALILLAGCVMVFKRKGGIVLLHFGICLLMANELYVTMTNVEQRMQVFEGETVSRTVDQRSTELMVLKVTEDGKHDVVMIPRDELLKDQVISRDDLPFDIECVEYHPNCELIRNRGLNLENTADSGIGTVYLSREIPVVAGVDPDEFDMAAAYVRLIDKKSNENIGIYLASQLAGLNETYDEIEVDGTTYYMTLRFRHHYKPYSITLEDVAREDYLGTEMAKSYSSEFVLNDHEKNISSKQRIWMNNPLRYGNETFYQSGHDKTDDGREYTVMQIVKNAGWMIPYVACMIVIIGLFAQFGSTLLKFLDKAQQKSLAGKNGSLNVSEKQVKSEPQSKDVVAVNAGSSRLGKRIALGLVVLITLFVGYLAMRTPNAKIVKDGMRLDLLGQLPVVYDGRVQPLDSLARNTLRKLANREVIGYPGAKSKMFGMRKDVEPAIRWLADIVFKAEGYDRVQFLRIEDLSVAGTFGAPQKPQRFEIQLGRVGTNSARVESVGCRGRKSRQEFSDAFAGSFV